MSFTGVNYLAILVAAIAAFGFGALYYGVLFSKPWIKASRIDPAAMKPSPVPFIVSFIAELVMAWVLAGLMAHLGAGQVTFWNGVISGLFVWLGFIATTISVNHRYENFGWDLTIIDAGHWLGVAIIMGAIIGWWGV
jgi:hypothetical protein